MCVRLGIKRDCEARDRDETEIRKYVSRPSLHDRLRDTPRVVQHCLYACFFSTLYISYYGHGYVNSDNLLQILFVVNFC